MRTTFIHIRLEKPKYNYGISNLITFNSKITNILAILLMIYLIYSQDDQSPNIDPAFRADLKGLDSKSSAHAMYKIVVPEDKKYDDYNPLEKLIYYFSKKQIGQ